MTRAQRWFILISIALLLLLLYTLSAVLTPFVLAALLAYLGDPLVNRLETWKVPRTLGVIIVFFFFTLILVLLGLIFIPMLEQQIVLLYQQIPTIVNWVQNTFIPWLNHFFDKGDIGTLKETMNKVSGNWQQAGGLVKTILSTISQSGMAIIGFGTNLVLVPVVGFYLLRDWDHIIVSIRNLLPRPVEPTVNKLARECNEVLGAFFRGQLLVMLGLGLIYSTGLWLAGLELALLIGFISGLVAIVPYLGFVVGIAAALIAALIQFHDLIHLVYVVIAFTIGQMAESMILTPLLVGDRIGLHPVAVIFAILAGGQLFGFVGILVALPVAAVIMVVLRHVHQRYVHSGFYHLTEHRDRQGG